MTGRLGQRAIFETRKIPNKHHRSRLRHEEQEFGREIGRRMEGESVKREREKTATDCLTDLSRG